MTAAELDLVAGGRRVNELMDEAGKLQKEVQQANDKGGKGGGGAGSLLS